MRPIYVHNGDHKYSAESPTFPYPEHIFVGRGTKYFIWYFELIRVEWYEGFDEPYWFYDTLNVSLKRLLELSISGSEREWVLLFLASVSPALLETLP